jgi:outer membrane protein TolC
MKRIVTLILTGIIAFFSHVALAQEDTLIFRYRRLAVDYQQQVKRAQKSLEGAESMLKSAKSDYLPRFDFGGNYSYYGVPLQLAPPADAPAGAPGEELHQFYSLDLTLNQPIITGGYLKNTKRVASSQVEALKSYVSLNKQEMMLNADKYYWKAVTRREIKDLLIKYRDAIGKFMDVIQDRVDEEIVGMNELYQVKVRYNDAQFDVLQSEKQYKISIMELNRLMGFPIDSIPEIADSLTVVFWQKQDDSLREKALINRPEISMLEQKILMNQYKEKVTASKYNPQLGVGAGGKWGAPSPGLNIDPAFNYYLKASLAIPIFYWGKKKEEVFAARQMTEIAKLDLEQTKDMVSLEVERSYYELERSQKQLDFAVSSLDNAYKNVMVMYDRYNEGLSPVIDVLDAQMFWQKTYFNYIQAKYQLNMAYSDYLRAMGELTINQ